MRNRVILAVLAASAGWGLAGVGTRAAYGLGATTVTLLAIRTGVATLALVAAVIVLRIRPTRLAWAHGALIGVLRIGITPLLFMLSLNYISAGVEGLVITLVPAVTAVLAAVFISETINRNQIIGLVIGLSGTTLIAVSGDSGLGAEGDIVAGFSLALGGVLVGSSTGVMQRHYAPRHDTMELALPMFASGTAVAVVIGILTGFDEVSAYTAELWVLIVVLGLGATLLPFALTLFASKHASATVVSMVGYLAPLVAVVAGIVILDEQLTPMIIAGGALAVVGVALVGGARRTQT
jgi:drug/metabolite transporter (DMT)-like permease